jgi:hypothetical protein
LLLVVGAEEATMIDGEPTPVLHPMRARALRALARRHGYSAYLGVALGACPVCDARRISALVRSASGSARRVGTLGSPRARYDVFMARRGPLPLRLIVTEGHLGWPEIVAIDRRRPSAPPPSYLGELEALELEEELKTMKVKVNWEGAPMTSGQADTKFSALRHLVYIPLDAAGKVLKVGQTAIPFAQRYKQDFIKVKGQPPQKVDKYWVGQVFQQKTPRGQWIEAIAPQVLQVEKLIARRLDRGGVPLPFHLTGRKGKKTLRADEPLSVQDVIPPDLHTLHADKPGPGLKPASPVNKIELAARDKYELDGAH